jgi:hygromycin-B 7''-O-kinase
MDHSFTLNSLSDWESYADHFMDLSLWQPYVRRVCEWHGYGCDKVSPGVPGTFPTFIVASDDGHTSEPVDVIVVKFFGPLFDGIASFRIERDMGRWLGAQSLPIPSPSILAEGQLDQDWQYLVFEHVDGVSIGQVWVNLSKDDRLSIAYQMGKYMHCLHTLTVAHHLELPLSIKPSLNSYTSFLQQQRSRCQANHQGWNDLPAHLLSQIEEFVLPVEQLIDFSAPSYVIHADLTADHLLGTLVNGRWQTLSIIDWGDAMTGNLLYELVALYLDLLQSEKLCLRECMDAYDLPDFYQKDFAHKALSMVLLHQFPMPSRVYEPYFAVRSLRELAECLFAV